MAAVSLFSIFNYYYYKVPKRPAYRSTDLLVHFTNKI